MLRRREERGVVAAPGARAQRAALRGYLVACAVCAAVFFGRRKGVYAVASWAVPCGLLCAAACVAPAWMYLPRLAREPDPVRRQRVAHRVSVFPLLLLSVVLLVARGRGTSEVLLFWVLPHAPVLAAVIATLMAAKGPRRVAAALPAAMYFGLAIAAIPIGGEPETPATMSYRPAPDAPAATEPRPVRDASADPASGPRRPPYMVWFENSRRFTVASAVKLDFERVAEVAEASLDLASLLLGYDAAREPPIPLYVCKSLVEMAGVVMHHNADPALSDRIIDHGIGGRYYGDAPLIVVMYREERMEATIAHEVGHRVIDRIARPCPPALHEGFAEVVKERFLWATNVEAAHRRDSDRYGWLKYGAKRSEARTLGEFLEMEYDVFHGENGSLHYALAWWLGESLLDAAGEEPAKLRAFLEDVAHLRDPWIALTKHFDAEELDRRFRDLVGG